MTAATSLIASPVDRDRWDRVVADSPQGSVFTRSAFLDALDVEWSVAGEEFGVEAVILREPTGAIARAPLPFTQYQGVLLAGEGPGVRRGGRELDRVEALLASLEGEGRMSWCLHPAFTDVRPFSWFHYHAPERGQFRVEVRYSGLIAVDPTAGLESVLRGARSVRRQEYRRAAARFQVGPVADLDLLDDLHQRTFARQGLARPEREVRLLRRIATAALRYRFGELIAAFDDGGRPAGAVLFLFDERSAYYLVAATDPELRSTGVATLLFLAGAERAIARGVRTIDVVGMNSPGRGDFKASLGAIPVPYYQVHWDRP
jgi:GNAT superfamily N-acetyltransferase